LHILLLKW